MSYMNSSSAYDFSAYAVPKQQTQPKLKVVKRSKKVISHAFTPKSISSFAIIVTLLCLMVYNQVQLAEVTNQINVLSQDVQELASENVELKSTLESSINLRVIAEQAKEELGMHRLDKHQAEYIYLQQEDKIALTDFSPTSSFGASLKLQITSFINRLQEYIAS